MLRLRDPRLHWAYDTARVTRGNCSYVTGKTASRSACHRVLHSAYLGVRLVLRRKHAQTA